MTESVQALLSGPASALWSGATTLAIVVGDGQKRDKLICWGEWTSTRHLPCGRAGGTLPSTHCPSLPLPVLPGLGGCPVNRAWPLPSGNQSSWKSKRSSVRQGCCRLTSTHRFPGVSFSFLGCGLRADDMCMERSPGLSRALSRLRVPFHPHPALEGRGDQN